MKTNLLFTILLMTTILLFSQCSKIEIEDFPSEEEQMVNFPEASEQFGLSVAKELNGSIRNLHKNGIDYSNADETLEFKEKFYNDFLKASPNAVKTRGVISKMQISPTEFTKRVNNLTKTQLEFIDIIIKECSASTSYSDFYKRIFKINNDIYVSVPEMQQERLFNITSVLYYSMKEIQDLETQGLMIQTPQSSMKRLLVKTRSESDGGSFGDSCRKFLATVWVIAVGEPTPAGEIVAAVATVFVGGVLLYEVVVCKEESSGSNYCYERFEDCISPIPDGCSVCLRYCLTQGSWPPYSTHKCS